MKKIISLAIIGLMMFSFVSAVEVTEENFNKTILHAIYENAYLRHQLGMQIRLITEENILNQGITCLFENPYLSKLLWLKSVRKPQSSSSGGNHGHGDWYPPEERDGYVKPLSMEVMNDCLNGIEYNPNCDFNKDGDINIFDKLAYLVSLR